MFHAGELKSTTYCRRSTAEARAAHVAELEARASAATSSQAIALKTERAKLTAELDAAREHAAERSAWNTEHDRQRLEAGEATARLAESRAAAAEWRRLAQQLEADIKQQVERCRDMVQLCNH